MKKNIFVVGGTSGIGLEIVRKLAHNSQYNVCATGRSQEKLKRLSVELGCETYKLDITNVEEIQGFGKWLHSHYKTVDAVISSVGSFIQGELDLTETSDISKIIAVNFTGNVLLFKVCIPLLKRQSSHLIYINSGMGIKPHEGISLYSATKWAMTGMMRSLELELARYGIKVTSIFPNKTKTDLFQKAGIEVDFSNALDASEIARVVEFILGSHEDTLVSEVVVRHVRHSAQAQFEKRKHKETFVLERK
jgi:short-subunit dehydrogenase